MLHGVQASEVRKPGYKTWEERQEVGQKFWETPDNKLGFNQGLEDGP